MPDRSNNDFNEEAFGRAVGHILVICVLAPAAALIRAFNTLRTQLFNDCETQELRTLRHNVRCLYKRYRKADNTADDAFIDEIVATALRWGSDTSAPIHSPALHYALTCVARELWEQELCDPNTIDWSHARRLDEQVLLRKKLRRSEHMLKNHQHLKAQWKEDTTSTLTAMATALRKGVWSANEYNSVGTVLRAPLIECVDDAPLLIEDIVLSMHGTDTATAGLYEDLRAQVENNLLIAHGIDPNDRHNTKPQALFPTQERTFPPTELVQRYLADTPYEAALTTDISLHLPREVRFEHCHILGGTGHGKTQLIQNLIYQDLIRVQNGQASVIILDSHGDLINTILNLSLFAPDNEHSLADKLVLIDPNDIEHPVALNMFDAHLERLDDYSAVEQEKILNGTIELYEYIFGALLGAELTQKQGVMFRYLARLMLAIPNATINTLRELLEDGKKYKPYMDQLDGTSRIFFQTQFFHPSFNATKGQMLKRLWGVLANPAFERMFAHPNNNIDLFDAMNGGKVVLINTAKDLLKQEGCEIFGRFFIAMLSQAAMLRAAIPKENRLDTFVYIDEAHDYFDDNIEHLLNQARKYRVALHLAHQNLGQLNEKLKANIMASTSIKFAGGVSVKDAAILAHEMRTKAEFLLDMQKRSRRTEFACFIKNKTQRALKVTVPLGAIEKQPTLSNEAYAVLISQNRERYAAVPEHQIPVATDACAPEAESTHRSLQKKIKKLGHERGFHVTIEQPVLDRAGRVDVALTRGSLMLACEVSVTTDDKHELKNIEKCIAAGFDQVLLISPDASHLKSVEKTARQHLTVQALKHVHFLTPETLASHLDSLTSNDQSQEKTILGYTAVTNYTPVPQAQRDIRQKAIAEVSDRVFSKHRP